MCLRHLLRSYTLTSFMLWAVAPLWKHAVGPRRVIEDRARRHQQWLSETLSGGWSSSPEHWSSKRAASCQR